MAATEFTIRRKVLTLFGAKFHIYNAQGDLLAFCNQKAFKLKEDIRLYTDESMAEERLRIVARQVIDFSAAYDVIDSGTNAKIGALKRKGWKSMLRDEWIVMDPEDREIGSITEDSILMAMIRRMLTRLVPQSFHLRDEAGTELAHFRTHFNPFVHRLTVRVYENCPLNPFLVLAGGLLLVAIEGRQQ